MSGVLSLALSPWRVTPWVSAPQTGTPSRQGLNHEDPQTDLGVCEEISCPCRWVCCVRLCNHRVRRLGGRDNGAASWSHLARQTKRGGSAYRLCRACAGLHDHRSLQERPLTRARPQPEAADARVCDVEVEGRREHDARHMADPGQLRQRRLIPDAFQGDPLVGAQGHSGTPPQACAELTRSLRSSCLFMVLNGKSCSSKRDWRIE
jgi:hypothetical protein